MVNRKGLTVFTWFIAFFVIVFILFVMYIPATLYMAKNFAIGGRGKVVFENGKQGAIETQRLVSFLEKPVKINGEIVTVGNMVEEYLEKEKYEKQLKNEKKWISDFSYEDKDLKFRYSLKRTKINQVMMVREQIVESENFNFGRCIMDVMQDCVFLSRIRLKDREGFEVGLIKSVEKIK